jgi:hypothetical protein
MTASTIVAERTVRRISPVFFIAAIVCFFFTFASVSCNTDAAKSTLQGIEGLGGPPSTGNTAAINRCLNALQGVNLATYTGVNFVFGSSPTVLTTAPNGCPSGTTTSLPGGGTIKNGDVINLGVQPLAVAAFAAIALGIFVSELGFFGLLRPPFRGAITTLLAVAALVTLVLQQAHLQNAITSKVSALSAGNGTTFNLASYFIVNNGVAYFVALVALGVGALYNAVSAFFGAPQPEPDELPPPEMGVTPPPGMRPAWPGLSPASGWWRRSARGRRDR